MVWSDDRRTTEPVVALETVDTDDEEEAPSDEEEGCAHPTESADNSKDESNSAEDTKEAIVQGIGRLHLGTLSQYGMQTIDRSACSPMHLCCTTIVQLPRSSTYHSSRAK